MDAGTQSQYSQQNGKGVTYYLNCKDVTLKGGRVQTIYYFTKDAGRAEQCSLPADRVVKKNPRNGFLTVAKKK